MYFRLIQLLGGAFSLALLSDREEVITVIFCVVVVYIDSLKNCLPLECFQWIHRIFIPLFGSVCILFVIHRILIYCLNHLTVSNDEASSYELSEMGIFLLCLSRKLE